MVRELNYNPVVDGQRHFRLLLDSMARPGKIVLLDDVDLNPPAGLNTASALITFALFNADVTFYIAPSFSEGLSYLTYNTGSLSNSIDRADFVLLDSATSNVELLEQMKVGEPEYPESGATLILLVESLNGNITGIELQGPGVDGIKTIYVDGLPKSWLATIKDINSEFPLGIDVILVDQQNQITCIPRSNQFKIIQNEIAWDM